MHITAKCVGLDSRGIVSRTGGFMLLLVCLICVVFPMSSNGNPAVGVIQGDIFMSWGINTTDNSSSRAVLNPAGSTVIFFLPNSVIGNVTPAFSNRIKDVGSVSLGNISFCLLNLTVADAGRYFYRLYPDRDAGGQVLIVAGVPANVSVIKVADPIENEKYTMQCSAQSTSVPAGMGLTMHYQWKRENGQIIIASDRYSFSSDQSNLSINPLKRQDAGTLVCEAWEHTGAVSQNDPFSLKVIYGPDPESIHLSPNKTSHKLTESSTLTVNCSTDCSPDCQYRWTGPGGSNASSTGLLSIISIGRSQTGQYTCTASNSKLQDKTSTATISVAVFYPPVLTVKATNTSKGGRVVVNCTASGVPNNYTFYKWTHMAPDESRTIVRELDLTRVSGSEVSLIIEGATYQDTGFYACRASNGIAHYSTGQLIMDDMVLVWITDQPIITSNIRDFEVEKGKYGLMYIEFYSGLFQPTVTWYYAKNGSMELLQNSSGLGILLSPVAVQLQFHQKTVWLPGYNASLEVFYVDQEHFTSYMVEINNSFARPVFETLELKPRVLDMKDELKNPNGSPVIIGAATGSALVLVIAVVSFLVYKRRQNISSSEEDVDVVQDKKSLSDRHENVGLVVNTVYDSSGPLPDPSTSGSVTGVEYAAVVKQKKKAGQVKDPSKLYAHVDKTNKEKKKGDIYENATLAGRDNLKGNTHENSGDLKADENVYENPSEEAPKQSSAKKHGLLYADLALDPTKTKNGKYNQSMENHTEYAEIAFGKRGESLPDNDTEQEINGRKG